MIAALVVQDQQPMASSFKFTTSAMLVVDYLGNMTL